jgi:peroxin-3
MRNDPSENLPQQYHERSLKWLRYTSTLLPSTRETLHHVLTQAGIRVTPPPDLHLPPIDIAIPSTANGLSILCTDETFDALLFETTNVINSANFSAVLEAAFDHITEEVLLSGLLASVFGDKALDNAGDENSEPQMRLAAMLPGLTRWSRLALTSLPNEIVDVSDMRLLYFLFSSIP